MDKINIVFLLFLPSLSKIFTIQVESFVKDNRWPMLKYTFHLQRSEIRFLNYTELCTTFEIDIGLSQKLYGGTAAKFKFLLNPF